MNVVGHAVKEGVGSIGDGFLTDYEFHLLSCRQIEILAPEVNKVSLSFTHWHECGFTW